MEKHEETEARKSDTDEHQHGPNVKIQIDGKEVEIHRGHKTVAEIKAAGGVPLAYELNQIIGGKLTPLPDDGGVTIHGGEQFVSQPKSGGSS